MYTIDKIDFKILSDKTVIYENFGDCNFLPCIIDSRNNIVYVNEIYKDKILKDNENLSVLAP